LAVDGKLQFIDFMRGLAILMVMAVHVGLTAHIYLPYKTDLSWIYKLTNYGQLGVQLFFVASAYTLCLACDRRRNEKLPVVSFFVRRYFRIAPLYYVGIILYFAMHALKVVWEKKESFRFFPYNFENVLANIFFYHGFYLSGNNSVVPGGWSIGTEMAFYLFFPLIFWFCD